MENYYSVVLKPSENKNKEEPLKTEEEIAFSAENNESNDNDSTVITTIRPEKGTIMEPNTAPADDGKYLRLDKTKDKNREKVESSGEKDEDGSLNEINSKNENKNTDEQQTYFRTGPEKATDMEANTVPPSVGVSSSGRTNMEGFD